MKKIHDFLNKYNLREFIVVITFIAIITYLLMLTNVFGLLKFDKSIMLDLSLFYNGNDFIDNFLSVSETQLYYYQIIHIIDYVFIFTFYPVLTFILSKQVKKQLYLFILVPILSMMFDLFENLIIDFHIHFGVSKVLGSICGIITLLKFISIILTILLILIYYIRKKNYEKIDL